MGEPDDAHEENHTVLLSPDSTFCTFASMPRSRQYEVAESNHTWYIDTQSALVLDLT